MPIWQTCTHCEYSVQTNEMCFQQRGENFVSSTRRQPFTFISRIKTCAKSYLRRDQYQQKCIFYDSFLIFFLSTFRNSLVGFLKLAALQSPAPTAMILSCQPPKSIFLLIAMYAAVSRITLVVLLLLESSQQRPPVIRTSQLLSHADTSRLLDHM